MGRLGNRHGTGRHAARRRGPTRRCLLPGLGLVALGCWQLAGGCGGTVRRDFEGEILGDGGRGATASGGPAAGRSQGRAGAGPQGGEQGASLSDAYFVVAVDESELEATRNAACTGWAVEGPHDGLVLMLTIDMSESMLAAAAATQGRTQWDATRSSLATALATWSDDTALGMLLFPNLATSPASAEREPAACVATDLLIPLDVLGRNEHRSLLLTALQSAEPVPPAATPLHDAYVVALEYFATVPAAGSKYVVLVTDGRPTLLRGCLGAGETDRAVDEQPIIDEIATAYLQMGIKTLVVGTPGSEAQAFTGVDARPWLSAAAEAGGTARAGCSHSGADYCHLDLSGEADFGTALAQAIVLPPCGPPPCQFAIPRPPEGMQVDLDAISVFYWDSEGRPFQVLESETIPCERGWQLTRDDALIEICSDTCEWLSAHHPCGRPELMFGCY